MKRFTFYFAKACMAILMVAAVSCSKDGDGDPEGTMSITLLSQQ